MISQASILPGLMGWPKYYSGAFAIVVPLRLGTTKAIRMFTIHVEDAEAHYNAILASLRALRLPYKPLFKTKCHAKPQAPK